MNLSTENTKKALDCCVNQSNCQECPLHEEHVSLCFETACKNALCDIIDLENENKKLQTENVHLMGEIRQLTADKSNLLDICMTEKAKVNKLLNKLIDMARKLLISKKWNEFQETAIDEIVSDLYRELDILYSFYAVMKITPRSLIVPAVELEAEWIYNPKKKIYIANGVEYSKEICEIVMIAR